LLVEEHALGADHAFVADTLTSLGYLEAQAGHHAEAEGLLARALANRQQALGSRHPDVTQGLVDVARARHAAGALTAARPLYEEARRNLLLVGRTNEGLDEASLARVWRAQVEGLEDYALLLSTIATDSAPEVSTSAVADAFLVAQQARDWIVQAAVANALAERQAGDSSEVELTRRVAALRRQRQAVWTDLSALYGEARKTRDDGETVRLKAELQRTQQELDAHVRRLRETFPRHAELAVPEPLGLARVQRLLRAGEALVMLYGLADRLQIWAVRADRPVVYRTVAVSRSVVQSLVDGVRTSVVPKEDGLPAFDVESAARLYRLLFEPITPALGGVTNVVVVPDAVLLPLPFAALLTAADADAYARAADWHRRRHVPSAVELAHYGALAWLAASRSVTVLPSASTLQLIRDGSRDRVAALEPFIGFGDPVLRGSGRARGGAMLGMRGARVPVERLHALDPLPGAGQELVAVARALAVDPDTQVFAGDRATETMVRRLHAEGRLGRAGVLAFATHGLLAGELQGLHQPALVLTPPETPTDDDDGLLSLDEVLGLRLPGNRLVVLSACNTAGSDGSGESLSGLARAFFFAGSRGLLVSQWSVGDRAAQALMADVFRRYGADGSVPAAEALRQAMLAMIEEGARTPATSYFAHPFAWAAFSLVGDPRSRE
jgi:CHAT domain-containing protein